MGVLRYKDEVRGRIVSRSLEWQQGWRAVVASSVGYGTGVTVFSMTAGLFVKPMQSALGWSVTEVMILPIITLISATTMFLAGLVVARWGSRRAGLVGHTLLALGMLALAIAPPDRAAIYTGAVFIGLIAPLTTTPPFARCISTWFDRSAGLALGITMNGGAFVALFSVPITSAAIGWYGWRGGFVALSMIIAGLGLPMMVAWLRERTEPLQTQTGSADGYGWSLKQAIGSPLFWLLLASIGLGGIPLGGFLTHIQPMLAESGVERTVATGLGVALAVSISFGRIGGGFLLDRFFDGGVAFGLLLLSSLGALILMMLGPSMPLWMISGAVLLVGLGQGAEADFLAYFALKIFGTRSYPKIVSLLAAGAVLGFAMGGLIFAKLRDWLGDYREASLFGAACFIAAGTIILITRLADLRRRKAS